MKARSPRRRETRDDVSNLPLMGPDLQNPPFRREPGAHVVPKVSHGWVKGGDLGCPGPLPNWLGPVGSDSMIGGLTRSCDTLSGGSEGVIGEHPWPGSAHLAMPSSKVFKLELVSFV